MAPHATDVLDATHCAHVTTACRVSEVVVSPDDGHLRGGTIRGAVCAALQRMFARLRADRRQWDCSSGQPVRRQVAKPEYQFTKPGHYFEDIR